ncbi:MAG: hypothetical protein HQL27_00235 [Candidatus Omnitrophica bacterium]|nr:hypothetical protein [Candidatus Omnitrophota bacterium]
MRAATVFKITSFSLLVILLVFFIFENVDPVRIWIPLFKGRHIGLIYIILASFFLGVISTLWTFTIIGGEIKRRKKLEELPEDEKPLFEDEE